MAVILAVFNDLNTSNFKMYTPINHRKRDYCLEDYVQNFTSRYFTIPTYKFFSKRNNPNSEKYAEYAMNFSKVILIPLAFSFVRYSYDLCKYGFILNDSEISLENQLK